MKTVIFAGGKGTRLSEESHLKPKPMIEIGGKPILWHIMKIYASQGFDDFVICLGYRAQVIKEYFINYFMYNSDITVDLKDNNVEVHSTKSEKFKVTLVDTGLDTMTAGRLKRVQDHIGNEDFMLTYGDGVANVDLKNLLEYHKEKSKTCTMTAIQSGSRFGIMDLDEKNVVQEFIEKPKDEGTWINGGYFVLSPKVFDYLKDDADEVMWEAQPLDDLCSDRELVAFKHTGSNSIMKALFSFISWKITGSPAFR